MEELTSTEAAALGEKLNCFAEDQPTKERHFLRSILVRIAPARSRSDGDETLSVGELVVAIHREHLVQAKFTPNPQPFPRGR